MKIQNHQRVRPTATMLATIDQEPYWNHLIAVVEDMALKVLANLK